MNLRERFAAWTGTDEKALVEGGWQFVPCWAGQEVGGIGALRGYEIHFAVAPDWRKSLITRRRLREFLGPLFNRKGFLTTRAMRGDFERIKFLLRLGFRETRCDGDIHHFMLSALPYSPEN